MTENTNSYEKITTVLRNAKPELPHPEIFTDRVMETIKSRKTRRPFIILDYLFGWVYIAWVRNGLVTAALMFVVFFAVEQSIILKRVNDLEKQAVYSGKVFDRDPLQETKLVLYRNYSDKISGAGNIISEKDMKVIYESLNEIQTRYRALLKVIENNPELKKYIEKKLSETEKKKFKL